MTRLLWLVGSCLFLALIGLYIDVTGHLVRPRDAFWGPTHALIYAPLLAAAGAAWAFLFFGPHPPGAAGVRVPFLARTLPPPLLLLAGGLFLIPAGGLFDQWWHAALGERETLYSLPHMLAISGGALAAAGMAAELARDGRRRDGLFLVLVFGGFLVLAGLLLGPLDIVGSREDYGWLVAHRPPGGDPALNRFETSRGLDLHRQNGLLLPVLAAAAMMPLLAVLRRLSPRRWALTEAALFYTAVRGLLAFALSPETGRWPFLPPPMPVLLPALVFDVLAAPRSLRSLGQVAILGGLAGFAFWLGLVAMGSGVRPLGLAGAVAAGGASSLLAGPVAGLLGGLTPRRAGVLLAAAVAASFALGSFDLYVRGPG